MPRDDTIGRVQQPPSPSGTQVEIRHGDQRAIAVTVGGGLRLYEAGGAPVLDGYPEEAMRLEARG